MKLHETACPGCGVTGMLTIEEIFYAKPIGSFSLAGMQAKRSGCWIPVLTCLACDFTRPGKYDGDSHAVFDAA